MKKLPTDTELGILHVLWHRGPATVREVHDALANGGAYTTTLKMLQVMFDKKLVTRDERQRSHIYQAAVTEELTERGLVADLMAKAFGGSAAKMAMRALSLNQRLSGDDLRELQELIDAHGEKARK